MEARKANRPVAAKFRDLGEIGAARFLFALLSQRFTGRVLVTDAASARELLFKGGLPIGARAHEDDGHRLGAVLVRQGSVTQEQLEEVLALPGTADRLLGQSLREAGFVDAIALERALQTQCFRRLVDLFARPSAPLEVLATRPEASPVEVDPLGVIAEGVRVHYDAPRITRELADEGDGRWKLDPQSTRYRGRFRFRPEESAVFDAMAEAASGFSRDRLVSPDGRLEPEAALRVFFIAHACGLLQSVTPKVAVVQRDEAFEELLGPLEDALADGLPAHEVLGLKESASLEALDAAYQELRQSVREVLDRGTASEPDQQRARDILEALEETFGAARNRRTAVAERKALELERLGDHAGALAMLEDVLAGGVNSPKVRALEAWCRFKTADDPSEVARSTLESLRSILADGDTARGQLYLGFVSLEAGDRVGALGAFEAALALDPQLSEAAEQLDALRGEAHSGVHELSPSLRDARSGTRRASPRRANEARRPRSRYWSGPWPAIWVFFGILLSILVGAQVVLRMNF